MKKLFNFRLLVLIGVLITSINTAWAYEPHFYFTNGDLSWTGSATEWKLTSPASSGTADEFSTFRWMTTNELFGLNNGTNRYGPSTDQATFSAGTQDYRNTSFKYTGATGLVQINAAESNSREWYPYLWLTTGCELEILRGNKIMFYVGVNTAKSKTKFYLSSSSKISHSGSETYYNLKDTKESSYIAVAYVSSGIRYYISDWDSWAGVQMAANAVAGNLYSLYNDGDDKIKVHTGAIPAFSSSTYNHATGVAVSSISATASNSIYGNPQEIKYYYTTSSTPGSASFTAFDPSDISGLSAGTYYIYALGWDGHILVRSAAATLTVADAPGISLSIEDGSDNVITAARSGDEITLKATPVNAGVSPNIVFEWSSSSTFASDIHEIANSTDDEVEWTIPTITATTTYYFRARITTVGKVCSSAISSFTGYGKKTIHVRNNNNWASFKIHHWGTNDAYATTWGDGGSSLPACTSEGGQWYTVVIYSCYDGFVLTNGGSNNQDKTEDLRYGSGSPTPADGGYYTMSTNANSKQTLSSSSAPSAPTSVTTSDEAPTSMTNSQMTLNGSIGTNGNDAITDYGFYWGTTSTPGTQARIAASDHTGSISKQLTSLTAGTTYYYKAYATNGQGTSYGNVESYKLPYKVTVNTSTGCSEITNSGTNYTNSTIEVTATKTTGYTFSSWSTTNGTQTSTSSEGNTNTLVFTPTSDNATISPVYTENSYSTTIVATNGSSPTSPQTIKQVTGTSLTATANTNYVFTGWSYTGGGIALKSPSTSTSNPATFTATSTGGTITANFADEWNVKGSGTELGAWETYNGMPATGVANTFSKTFTLPAKTTYNFKVVKRADAGGEDVWYGVNGGKTLTRASGSVTGLKSGGGEGDNISFTTDAAGTYTITYVYNANEGSMQVSVGYPEAYAVTYSAIRLNGSGDAWSDDPSAETSASLAVTSGDMVLDGSTVTFTAAEANPGYTFKGWYSEASPATWDAASLLATTASYTTSITAATTIYAVYDENDYTVTVQPSDADRGSVASNEVTGHKTTSVTLPTATASTGYYFTEWTSDYGTITDEDQASTASINNLTSTATATANFAPIWTISGTMTDPEWKWDATSNVLIDYEVIETKNYGYATIALEPNSTYSLKVKDRTQGKDNGWYGIPSDNTATYTYANDNTYKDVTDASGNQNIVLTTAGGGDYLFSWNLDDKKLAIDFPTSYTITYGKVVSNGQDIGDVSVTGDDDVALASEEYVAKGTATFTATDAPSGYSFIDWRTSDTYGEGTQLSTANPYTMTSIAANKTVYAHYAENLCTVTITANNKSGGSITVGGEAFTWGNTTQVGVDTKYTLVATPATGYYFAGWTLSDGADCSIGANTGEDYPNVTLTGLGAELSSTATLTANFLPLEKVYFRNWNADSNVPLWSDVYVYFNVTFVDDCAKSNSSSDFKAQMALESGNVYWAYVPRSTTRAIGTGGEKIAFSNTSFETNTKFNSGEAVKRGDYSSGLSMFVPRHASSETTNSTKYYRGYWKHHNLEPGNLSGYSIQRYDGSSYVDAADNGADKVHFIVEDENTIRYSLRVDNVTDSFNRYVVESAGDIKYITYNTSAVEQGYNITTTNYSGVHMSEKTTGSPRFYITPTTQNLYTLTIDMSGDEMLLTVDYPVALGDYRIVHTYSSGTKRAYSDIIKSSEAASGVTASMYINTSGSPTLTLEKCTDISPLTWTPQSQGSVWGSQFTEDNGVYQFNVTITTDASDDGSTISGISNIKIYDGEFYIKTDCAPGGWTAWKANVMEKNTITFDEDDANTFDRSFCHWIDDVRGDAKPMNVKCVIANDYNIAVSDTLVGDNILGEYDSGSGVMKPWENIPSAAHVRFSYNSTTNQLKRTYLAVTGDDHLILEGSTDGEDKMIHDNTAGDGAAFTNNKATLSSLSNFTFYVDVKAREQARARLSATYNNVVQDLIGSTAGVLEGEGVENSTVEVLGGDGSTYKTIRIIYDFKTNYLMSAWIAGESIVENKVLDADLIIIREGQGEARQITFSGDYSISKIGKVYGVMEFNKWTLNNKNKEGEHETLSPALSPYERDLYWISFPFDVKLSDAFGMGTYGIHWIIERYDGKGRAKNGFWADSESNWKFVTPYQRDSGFVMNANEGYILALDLDELGEGSLVWDNDMTDAYLYFPSKDDVGSIQKTSKTVTFANQSEYLCTIGPRFEGGDDRRIKDSYWHCIGVPSYAEKDTLVNPNYNASDIPNVTDWSTQDLPFLYEWRSNDNSLAPRKTSGFTFKPMYSYLVQYSKDAMLWKTVNATPAAVAARMTETPNLEYELALLREDDEQDRTYVRMTDDVNVSTGFEFNYDLSKEMNRNRGNIWTVTADTVQVAGNSQPHPLTTTIVPVGVKIAANGEYTFSMPEGTNGGDVWLIDNANSSRTNLGLMDYTVNLTVGTYEGRFSLEFPVQNVVTEIENAANANANANANADAVRKVFVGGQLYIIRDGVIYNASGARVQ